MGVGGGVGVEDSCGAEGDGVFVIVTVVVQHPSGPSVGVDPDTVVYTGWCDDISNIHK